GAGSLRVSGEAAGTGIHRRDQEEIAGKDGRAAHANQTDAFFLERLPDRLQHVPPELGKLVEKEDASMGERDLAGPRPNAASDEAGRRDSMVRRSKRRDLHQPRSRWQGPPNRLNLSP